MPLLLLDGSSTSVFGFPLFTLENLRSGVKVLRQKVARLLGRFGHVSPVHLDPATFDKVVIGRPSSNFNGSLIHA